MKKPAPPPVRRPAVPPPPDVPAQLRAKGMLQRLLERLALYPTGD